MKSELKRLFPRAAMTFLVMLLTTVSAWADSSGSCGTNVTYTYSESTHTLTISGNGAMADYANADAQPWKDYRSNITSVVIESGVTHIGNNAFTDCRNLATVTFAAGSQLTSIGDLAFYYCNNSLNTITIPASVQTIGSNAFNSCSNLATVTFATGSQLTTIENSAFDKCSALTAFTVPSGVTSIGDGAFSNCRSLATINVEAGNTSFSSDGGVLFNYDKTILIQYPIGNSRTAYTIPGGVRTIGSHAFYLNKNLTSVTIATSVQTICDNAFSQCLCLATVAFAPCSQLESIGVNAFRYCALTSVTIPASVTSIRERAFDSCYFLTSVTIYAPGLTTYGLNAFDSNDSGRKIYVCSDRVDFYKSINQWSAYASAIEAIPDLTVNDAGGTLGKWTTYYNGLTDVTVADGTTIYKATYDNVNNNVTLTPVSSNIIKMGEAVLLKSDANIVLESANDSGTGDYTGNDLHGVDYATPLTDLGSSTDTYYVLSNKNGHFGFHKYTGTNMPANKAFLRISGDGNALAPSIDLYIDNNATNIQTTDFTDYTDSDAWYTLDGRKLNAQPTKKGLYIVNGKKVVIK
jgi:hypothetical protein